jgi:hypothetical protein
MLDKFFGGWYRITKLENFNFVESLFHKFRKKGGERGLVKVIVISAGGNYSWLSLPAPITITKEGVGTFAVRW